MVIEAPNGGDAFLVGEQLKEKVHFDGGQSRRPFPPRFLNPVFSLEVIDCHAAYPQHLGGLGNVIPAQLHGFDDSPLLYSMPTTTVSPASLLLVGNHRLRKIQILGFDELVAGQDKGPSDLIGKLPDISGPSIILYCP